MTFQDASNYVSFQINDREEELTKPQTLEYEHCSLVGWQCGFEPLFVAIYGHYELWNDDAIDIATEFLQARQWFAESATPADYVLKGFQNEHK